MTEHHFTLEHGDFSAKLVLGGKHSLYDFAVILIKTVRFDFDHPFEFCDNLKRPYRSKERYSLFADMGHGDGELGVEETLVSEVFRPRRKMIFHFDYGDDWYFLLTCTAVKQSDKSRRFHSLLSTTGSPPVQYPDFEEEE